jgi:hypothetical protein
MSPSKANMGLRYDAKSKESWLMMTAQPRESAALVEQDQVGAGFQHLDEMDSIALARELADFSAGRCP